MADLVFKVRANTTEGWTEWIFPPVEREVTFDTTKKRLKIGDGTTLWKDLPYVDIDVIDNLTTSDSRPALSANQGVVLKTMINTKADKTELTQLQEDLTQIINNHKVSVVDELKSTNSHTDPLSAYQGYVLDSTKASKDELTTLQTNITNEINNSKVTVVNNLTDTSTNKALSANMGTKLNTDKLDKTSVTSESWTFTLEDESEVQKKVAIWSS